MKNIIYLSKTKLESWTCIRHLHCSSLSRNMNSGWLTIGETSTAMPAGLPQGVTQSEQKSCVQGRSEYYTQNKLNTNVNFKHAFSSQKIVLCSHRIFDKQQMGKYEYLLKYLHMQNQQLKGDRQKIININKKNQHKSSSIIDIMCCVWLGLFTVRSFHM